MTYEVKDRRSPVAAWLSAMFPQHKEIQAEFCIAAGPQRVLVPAGVASGTQGAAIDFWLRMLVDPQPSIALPLVGLLSGRAPCVPAGKELLRELAAGESPRRLPNGEVELRMRPAVFAGLTTLPWPLSDPAARTVPLPGVGRHDRLPIKIAGAYSGR